MLAVFEQPQARTSNAPYAVVDSSGDISFIAQDEQLAIARTRKGDLDAFNELVLKYQQRAFSVAYRLLQTREAAADAVQDSFLKAFRALPSYKGGSFKSWLMRIVVNTCYDVLRIERRYSTQGIHEDPEPEGDGRIAYQLVDAHESPAAVVERMELQACIEAGLRILPAEQRLAVALSDIHGYSYEEIAEMTGMPMGTVKSRISRARGRLRDFLMQRPELLPAHYGGKAGVGAER